MIRFIIFCVVILISFGLECILSNRKNFWPGLILPAITLLGICAYLMFNLGAVFSTMEGFGLFLTEYGSGGFFALLVKTIILFLPLLIQLGIYFACRYFYKKRNEPLKNNKEFKKMIAKDLD